MLDDELDAGGLVERRSEALATLHALLAVGAHVLVLLAAHAHPAAFVALLDLARRALLLAHRLGQALRTLEVPLELALVHVKALVLLPLGDLQVAVLARLQLLVLEDLEGRQAVADVLLVLEELDLAARDRHERDVADGLEQLGALQVHSPLTRQVVDGAPHLVRRTVLAEQVLDGVRHHEHAVDHEVNEAVLGDVELLLASAQLLVQARLVRLDQVRIQGAVELLFLKATSQNKSRSPHYYYYYYMLRIESRKPNVPKTR